MANPNQADDEIACPECGSVDTSRGLSLFAAFSRGNGGTSVSVGGSGADAISEEIGVHRSVPAGEHAKGDLGGPAEEGLAEDPAGRIQDIAVVDGLLAGSLAAHLFEEISRLRNHGASLSEEERHRGPKPYLLPEFEVRGGNYRLTDLQGALGLSQLSRLPVLIEEGVGYLLHEALFRGEMVADIVIEIVKGFPARRAHFPDVAPHDDFVETVDRLDEILVLLVDVVDANAHVVIPLELVHALAPQASPRDNMVLVYYLRSPAVDQPTDGRREDAPGKEPVCFPGSRKGRTPLDERFP